MKIWPFDQFGISLGGPIGQRALQDEAHEVKAKHEVGEKHDGRQRRQCGREQRRRPPVRPKIWHNDERRELQDGQAAKCHGQTQKEGSAARKSQAPAHSKKLDRRRQIDDRKTDGVRGNAISGEPSSPLSISP